ncbi:response regulator transcription factor [Noviherbaspirillum autotrophicum]|uniref:Chemotaxis protein CheY n=1 Tax=Noviherbaspirillum autotrophicum TaxID=709839 RepID=A0A0C2BQX4_9BURK|nr:response regulator [Noviherbaspirillum autotrophicum]KIF83700.1 chemotaxis protein CheY [Noviherbaspirillum autotrophicum]
MARKILIVDDEPNIVISLEFLMQQRGYEVALAHNGEQALQQMETFRPDLVLLDVLMPSMDGYEVCRKIRERSDWGAVKIVMLSAKVRDVDISKGLALGADAYITKPFSTRQLMASVGDLLSAST